MKTRCKFSCNAVKHWMGREIQSPFADKVTMIEVTMNPVYSNDPTSENKEFWDSTPSGSLTLNLSKPGHVGLFQVGKDYYLDITEVVK